MWEGRLLQSKALEEARKPQVESPAEQVRAAAPQPQVHQQSPVQRVAPPAHQHHQQQPVQQLQQATMSQVVRQPMTRMFNLPSGGLKSCLNSFVFILFLFLFRVGYLLYFYQEKMEPLALAGMRKRLILLAVRLFFVVATSKS
jgi:hypothetical protein